MTIDKLARKLRGHLRARGVIPEPAIDLMDDDSIIRAYTTCANCGGQTMSDKEILFLIDGCESVKDWTIAVAEAMCDVDNHEFASSH